MKAMQVYSHIAYIVKPNIIQTPDIIFDIISLVCAGHYSSFM